MTLVYFSSLFNIFAGVMLTASLLLFGTAFIVWITRLGNFPGYRTTAIHIGEWAVIILFVLIVLMTVVQFFRDHPHAAAAEVGTLVFIAVVWAILYFALFKKEEEH